MPLVMLMNTPMYNHMAKDMDMSPDGETIYLAAVEREALHSVCKEPTMNSRELSARPASSRTKRLPSGGR